jgi:Asp-tRNA(Asn)/Glu-tRNA(Gln) amidotransferase A subunit family amidase
LQLIGPPRSEAILLQAAHFMEQSAGVFEKLPLTGPIA